MKISHWLVVATFIAPLLACSASDNGGTSKAGHAGAGGAAVGGSGGGLVGGNGGATGGTGGATGGTGGATGGTGGATGGTGGATGGSGGTTGGDCGLQLSDATCNSCMNQKCLTECNSLAGAKDVSAYIQCIQGCGQGDKTCMDNCTSSYPEASKASGDLDKCLGGNCATECGGSSGGCGLQYPDATIDACMKDKCNKECVDATNAEGLSDYLSCAQACADGDTACQDTCGKTYPKAAAALDVLSACIQKNCANTDPNKCGIQAQGNDTCNACINGKCLDTCKKCAANDECLALLSCINGCAQGDSACQQKCQTDHANGVNDLMDFLGDNGCLAKNCATECK